MRGKRKWEHIQGAMEQQKLPSTNGFADVRLIHQAMPESDSQSIDIHTRIGELDLSSPIVINAMTGGSDETAKINEQLAAAAAITGTAMAVGSQMAALKDAQVRESYTIVRRRNPNGIIFANLGSEATLQQAKDAVEMLEANALQIHLNVMQELIMPEGDRDFRGQSERIARIVQELQVPVIVKEVGFGIMQETAMKLKQIGVSIIDVGGKGGTNFAAIENRRRDTELAWLNDWGHSTSIALLECQTVYSPDGLIASGGLRDAMDVVKAISLGAGACGIAGPLLQAVLEEGESGAVNWIAQQLEGLRLMMTALGAGSLPDLRKIPVVIVGDTAVWCNARGISLPSHASR